MLITLDELYELVDYDPVGGVFKWHVSRKGVNAGDVIGSSQNRGYMRMMVRRRSYLLHRLAWFYVHGKWPNADIDHINGDRTDNRICNLREATRAQNLQNRTAASRSNKSGFLGVSANKNRWSSRIYLNGQLQYLGTFDTPEEARAAYLAAKPTYHSFSNPNRLL